MQQSQNRVSASSAHRKVKGSTVHNRKTTERTIIDVNTVQQRMGERKRVVQTEMHNQTAREMKETEIKKAIKMVSSKTEHQKKNFKHSRVFGIKNIALAVACATVGAFIIVYYVNLSTPDVSLKVAAMQTGIDAKYPNFTPRDYKLSDIMSENGKITLNFKNVNNNSEEGGDYSIIEERSSWDSNALYANYVKDEFSSEYTTIKEQGLTIYIDGSNAAWVNGGVFYKLVSSGNILTKKQITAIAVSL